MSPDGFPFSGLVTLIGALLSLLVELSASHSHSHEISLSLDDGVPPINGSALNPYTKVGEQEMACHKGRLPFGTQLNNLRYSLCLNSITNLIGKINVLLLDQMG